MNVKVNLSKVTPIAKMYGESKKETSGLYQMAEEASDYLKKFNWHNGIIESYLGIGIPNIIGVFLFKVKPAKPEVDEWVWVVVGDLPPAYITAEQSPNPAAALDAYIGAMAEWVTAVKAGNSTEKLIPVNAPPTIENAKLLESRLKFLDNKILAYYREDLKEHY